MAPEVNNVKRNSSVFYRYEDHDKVLLVRPAREEGAAVHLLGEPGRSLWQTIERGATLRELRDRFGDEIALSGLAYLTKNKLIAPIDSQVEIAEIADGAFEQYGLHPWDYQFSRPYLDSPWYVLWEVTDRCPLKENCKYCYRPLDASATATPDQWRRIIEQIVAAEVPFVTLLGGEPLCHGDIFDIIRELRSHRIFVKLITNGLLVTDDVAAQLGEAGLSQIAVSLDGIRPETNDWSRGAGSYDAAVSAIEILQRHVPRVSISFTVSNRSIDDLHELPDWCARHGVVEVYMSPLRGGPNVRLPEGVEPLGAADMARLHETIADINDRGLKAIGLRECSCGRSSCVIHADGRFSPCPFATTTFGSVYEDDLAVLWGRVAGAAERIGPVRAGGYCFREFEPDTA